MSEHRMVKLNVRIHTAQHTPLPIEWQSPKNLIHRMVAVPLSHWLPGTTEFTVSVKLPSM
jgi:hypothetical protein